MSGQRQKHPDALTFRRGGRVKTLVTIDQDGKRQVPPANLEMPDGLCQEAQVIWEETIGVTREHLFPSDAFAVNRWIWWVDQWLRAAAQLKDEGYVIAGVRETRLNPRMRVLRQAEESIRWAETVLGLSPLARMRLGITFAMEQSALAALKGAGRGKPTRMRRAPAPKATAPNPIPKAATKVSRATRKVPAKEPKT